MKPSEIRQTSLIAKNRCYGVTALILLRKTVLQRTRSNTGFDQQNQSCNTVTPLFSKYDSQPEKGCVTAAPDRKGGRLQGRNRRAPAGAAVPEVFGFLQLRPPALVPENRWRLCVSDGSRFLAKWGDQAEALGWTSADLFGLHKPPERPRPRYCRLSRHDETGLCWMLGGRPVVALTETTATIRNPATGAITTYRRFNKPGLGPLGDSLEDLK